MGTPEGTERAVIEGTDRADNPRASKECSKEESSSDRA